MDHRAIWITRREESESEVVFEIRSLGVYDGVTRLRRTKRVKASTKSDIQCSIPPPGLHLLLTSKLTIRRLTLLSISSFWLSRKNSNSTVLEEGCECLRIVPHVNSSAVSKSKEGGSILEILEEMITVGQTMGFSMEGCVKDMEKIIGTQGELGGILFLGHQYVKKDNHIISDNFVALYGTWIPNNMKLLLISVYAPQVRSSKRLLWNYLSSLIIRWKGECLVMGDFNEVRSIDERWGSTFNKQGADLFNSFISSSGLIDIQMEGYSFTWAHPSASKMNHRPILLKEVHSDFGPTPFRFFHSWLDLPGFDEMISSSWASFNLDDSNAMIRFKKKLKLLKVEIRKWTKDFKEKQEGQSRDLNLKLRDIDKTLDQGGVTDDLLLSRMELMKQIQDIISLKTSRFNGKRQKLPLAIEFVGISFTEVKDCAIEKSLGSNGPRFLLKKFGGLGVSSLFALNRALIFKWVWRFLSHDNSLWSRVIAAVHGSSSHPISAAYNSPWGTIIKEVKALNDKEVNKDCSVADKLNAPFTASFRRQTRGGPEAQQLEQLTNLLDSVSLSNMEDRCFWDFKMAKEYFKLS
ncbi:RNA-directed DNA polymerase, eukaryota [Tanacetum coccineum]